MPAGPSASDPLREKAFQDYRKKLMEHKEVESRLKESEFCYDQIFVESSDHLFFFDSQKCLSYIIKL